MKSYEFKFICQKCEAVHYYRPKTGCQKCGKFFLKKVPNMTEEQENEEEYDLDLRLTFDKHDLENEWVHHPGMVHSWAENAADAQLQFDEAKAKLELTKAQLDSDIRKTPSDYGLEKLSEKSIENTIILQPEYQAALRNMNSARHDLKVADAAVTALEHRRKALSYAVELWIRRYNSDRLPKTSTEEGEEFEKRETRGRGRRRKQRMEEESETDILNMGEDLDDLDPDDFDFDENEFEND